MPIWSPDFLNPIVPKTLHHPVLEVALAAAREAGGIIAKYFHQGVEIRSKGIGELVTNADLEAESSILKRIREAFPSHAVMAEETQQEVADSEHLWVVDPLDGTNNFAHRIPHFAISIGYYRRGVPECGVIVNPIMGDWYVAITQQGAWYQGEPCRVNDEKELNESLIAIGFYYDRGAMMQATLNAVGDFFRKNIHGVRRFGTASLDLGQVGRGLFGAYFEYQLHPWDHAAGRLFVEEAGGKVTTCEGSSLPIHGKTSILASNGLLHPAALEVALPHWKSYVERR